MQLPLLLAGPILRRVEPTLVSVWVALNEPATVTLTLWEGRVRSGSEHPWISSDPPGTRTLRVGAQLHIALVLIEIPGTSPRVLSPGRTYSYDLEFTTASGTKTLQSFSLLKTGELEGRRIEALGFEDGFLPSFALPPAEITDLRVIFGSCRRPVNEHMDAMPWIDDLMSGENGAYSYKDPLKRPHQLFLGGDQIYADDVSLVHLHTLIDLGKQLIGTADNGEAIEHLKINHVREKNVSAPSSFNDYEGGDESGGPGELPADHAYFPCGRRFLLTTVEAQMTSTDGVSHLFSFGEFAAMYLSVWSNAVWPLLLPDDKTILEPTAIFEPEIRWKDRIATYVDAPLDADETRGLKPEDKKDVSPFQNYKAFKEEAEKDGGTIPRKLETHRTLIREFVRGLAKVRRVLANIPTYMIFDDHDVTDDWFLNPIWNDRVLNTSLGVQTIRNGLLSYALFQDWGNDPLKYKNPLGDNAKLLSLIGQMFPANAARGPSPQVADDIDALLGFKLAPMDPDGSVPETRPPITWHFSVPGPKHLAIALDNRTRRSYVSRNGPPGNVAISAQADQIPEGPLPEGKEVLLVIAPLQVLGPPLLDELIAPASYRVFDMVSYTFENKARKGLKDGTRGMAGTNPDAIEAWAFDTKTFEALLARLEPYRRVVLLSGDVHYSASNAMSYWKKGTPDPARIVQFTSSGFKNVMPSYIVTVDHSLPFAQAAIRAGIGAERLGWTARPASPVVLPPGKTEKDIPRALRARLKATPTLLPTYGWPAGTTINQGQFPDWSWHVDPILDLRADESRPAAARPLPLDEAKLIESLGRQDAGRALDAYQEMAARHQHALETLRNSRQILFRSNFGLVRFERRAMDLVAIHEIYTAFRAPDDPSTDPLVPEAFVIHEAALSVSGVERPEEKLKPLKSAVPT